MIIAMSGVDCAGKSTHIELLRQYFISQGKTCTVFWYRPGYSDEMQKLKVALRKGILLSQTLHNMLPVPKTRPQSDKPDKPDVEPGTPINKKIHVPAPIWLSTAILDTTLQWALKLRWLNKKYDVVICDRYIEDAKLDLQFKFPNISWSDTLLRHLSMLFPKPDKSFLLWLSMDEMAKRVEAKNEPFADDEHTRKMRYRAYEYLADEAIFTVIDASGDIESTHQKIRACL